MKIGIIGDLYENDYQKVETIILDNYKLNDIDLIITGEGKGVNSLVCCFAEKHSIPIKVISANWEKDERMAGVIRNSQIIEAVDELLFLPDKESKPTRNAIRQAHEIGKKYIINELTERWIDVKSGSNIYQMYNYNDHKSNFWVQRDNWENVIAKIISISDTTEGQKIPGKKPYYNNLAVIAEFYNLDLQLLDTGELKNPGNFSYNMLIIHKNTR